MIRGKILLFVPVYNCERQIQRVFQSFEQGIPEGVEEIIIVDNGSSDRTREVVISYIELLRNRSTQGPGESYGKSMVSIRYIRNKQNYGLGGSHKVAYQYALAHGFTGIITLHGDDQASLSDMKTAVEGWVHGQLLADAILGSRFSWKSRNIGYPLHRRLGNYVLNSIWSVILLRCIPDLGSGLNFISADIIKKIGFLNFPDSLVFNEQQLLELIRVNARIIFVPICWREEDQESNAVAWKVFLTAVLQVIAYRFSSFGFKQGCSQQEMSEPKKEYSFDILERADFLRSSLQDVSIQAVR